MCQRAQCGEGTGLEGLAWQIIGSKKEDLDRGNHHQYMIDTSYFFRAEGIDLKKSLVLSETEMTRGGARGVYGNAVTFIRQGTVTGSCPAGFTGSSGIG